MLKIALTIGHSILKNGNITSADGTKFGGCNEYKYNKLLAPYIKKYLESEGHKVDIIICPEKKFNKSTKEATYKLNIVNNKKYDLVVELHLNAADKTAQGCEVLYISKSGKKYATQVQKKLATVFKDRGIKKRDNLYMLTKTKPVTIMLETFFCTNAVEYNKAKSAAQMDNLGRLIAGGICNKTLKKIEDKPKKVAHKPDVNIVDDKQGYIKIVSKTLSYRNSPTWSNDAICGVAKQNEVFTVVDKILVSNTYMYKLKSGVYITSLPQYVKFAKTTKEL